LAASRGRIDDSTRLHSPSDAGAGSGARAVSASATIFNRGGGGRDNGGDRVESARPQSSAPLIFALSDRSS
jgi:hypothetical protein